MKKGISRRQFIRRSSASLLSLFLPGPGQSGLFRPRSDGPVRMGRAIHSVAIYDQPRADGEYLGTWNSEQTFPIWQEIRAPGLNSYNDLWYETSEGYVFSAWVQPLWVWPPQTTISEFSEWGFWGEICAPYTDALEQPYAGAASPYRFYNGTMYRVVDVTFDSAGNGWYKVYDELPPPSYQWVSASDVRRVTRSELAPIRPFAGSKRIEVDLNLQRITCLEGSRVVFSTPTSSGIGVREQPDGTMADFSSPEGDHCVLLKQPSRHMSNIPRETGDEEEQVPPSDPFDLPGVPWNTFFDQEGTAIHGAYWHNDFGVPRSHGCLNASIDAARWIYRWTYPLSGTEDDYVQSDCRVGTPIVVFK